MEVVVQSPLEPYAYLSAPSSPNRFGEYYPLSAPTSPSRLSEFYREFDYFSGSTSTINIPYSASSSIPLEPGTAAATNNRDGDDDDDGFAFSVTRESDKSSRSAEELFHRGKIKPLKPQNLLNLEANEIYNSPKSPLLSQTQKKKEESHSGDPFATEQRRGRDRTSAAMLSSSNSGRRVTRSHSPYRISHSHYTWDEEQHPHQQPRSNKDDSTLSANARASLSSTSSSSSSSKSSSRKWRFRDFLLFRSSSEGRGSSKDPLKKYSVLYKKHEEVKNSSVRSSDSPTTSAPGARRRGPVSPHELHYVMKKAESEDLKKRTFLPYKQGILGRLAGLGSLTR